MRAAEPEDSGSPHPNPLPRGRGRGDKKECGEKDRRGSRRRRLYDAPDTISLNSGVLTYRSPVSGSITTITLPGFSGRRPRRARPPAPPAGDPGEDPFLTREPAARPPSLLLGHRHHLVEDRAVEDCRARSRRRCPGCRGGPAAPPAAPAALGRLDGDDRHARLLLLQHLADAGDRAAGAHARDEDVDGAVGVLPDLLRPSCAGGPRGWPGSRTAAASPRAGSRRPARSAARPRRACPRRRRQHHLGASAAAARRRSMLTCSPGMVTISS